MVGPVMVGRKAADWPRVCGGARAFGVRLVTSTIIRPSAVTLRLHTDSGCLSPSRVSVTTRSPPRSTVAERHTVAPPSPSCETTPGPPTGSSSSDEPRRSVVRILTACVHAPAAATLLTRTDGAPRDPPRATRHVRGAAAARSGCGQPRLATGPVVGQARGHARA
eukprot:4829903-Prymnesium_polylepis.1